MLHHLKEFFRRVADSGNGPRDRRQCQPALLPEGRRRLRRRRDDRAGGLALPDLDAWRPRHAEWRHRRPACLRRHRSGRDGHHRRPPLGDGHRLAHLDPDGHRRRDGGRLGSREDRPGRRRRAEIRQPGHRRLAQPAPPHPAGPRDRRLGAPDAGGGGSQPVGRRSDEVQAADHQVTHQSLGETASATASWRPTPWRLPTPAREACASRTRRSSATSARAGCRSTICTTSRPARPSMAPMFAFPA